MKSKIVAGVAVAVLLLVVSVGITLFATGKIAFIERDSDGVASSTVPNVCDASIIDRYNAAMYYEPRGESEEMGLDEEGIRKLATDIKTKSDYAADPTCQVLLFLMAVHNKDEKEAKDTYEAVKAFHGKRLFPDNNIRSSPALFEYESLLLNLTPVEGLQDDRE